MSEMIERVGRALANQEGYAYDPEPYAARARAAIEAMRIPTPSIDSAMRRAFERQENIWSAGIDAALR